MMASLQGAAPGCNGGFTIPSLLSDRSHRRPAPAGLVSTREWPQNRRAVDTTKNVLGRTPHLGGRSSPNVTTGPASAGLFFCLHPRSHTHMDPDLENVIRQALGDALAAGKDHLSQTELAVRAVQQVRPDMTASDALAAVNMVRQS